MSNDTRILAELIRAKRACLLKVRDLGRRQGEIIGDGNVTGLLDLLAAKQPLLAKLQQIEGALDPYRSDDPEQRRWSTPGDRQRCAADLEACETLLAEIVSQEKTAEAALVKRRDETALRLDGAHLAGLARGAYSQRWSPAATQLDLTSDA
jgi:hypothetical protein